MEIVYYNSAPITGALTSIMLTYKTEGSIFNSEVLTCASQSISTESPIADTSEGPRCVGTHSIAITRRLLRTFINICANKYVVRNE